MTTTPDLHGLASVAAALRSIGQIAESGGSLDEVRTLAGAALGIVERLRSPAEGAGPIGYVVVAHEADGGKVTMGYPGRAHLCERDEAVGLRDWCERDHPGPRYTVEPVGAPPAPTTCECCERPARYCGETHPYTPPVPSGAAEPSHGLQPDRPIRDGLDDLGVGESERTTEGADDA